MFAEFLDAMPDATLLVGADGRLRSVNTAAEEMFGYPRRELVGQALEVLLPAAVRAAHAGHLRTFFASSGRRRMGEGLALKAVRKDGLEFPVEIALNRITADGETVVAAVVRDITARVRSEEALRASEARQRLVLETSPDAVVILDAAGVIEFASRTFSGAPAAALLGLQLVEFVVPRDRAQVLDALARARQADQLVGFELDLVDLSGTVRSLRGRARRIPSGPRDTTLIVFSDVTAVQEAERELEQLREAMEAAVQGIARVAASGRFLRVNAAYATLLGRSIHELDGAAWKDCFAAEAQPALAATLALAQRQGRAVLENVGVRRAGAEARLDITMVRAIDRAGAPAGHYCFMRDVTDQHLLREQLQVSDRMASVGMLAAGVAHEINNPLAAVLANLDTLAAETTGLPAAADPTGEWGAMLSEARACADRVRVIVRDLRVFARHEDERTEPVDVEKVIDSALRMARNEIRHRARLVTHFGTVALVDANEARLGQVFLNLLMNAAQAIPEGNVAAHEIRVTTRAGPSNRVVVEVADTGSGITPTAMARLFTPFFTTKAPGVGTGLGLAICHRLIIAMGGTISVDSRLGSGTTFTVTLAASREAAPVVHALPALRPAARRGRVLVVDDEPMICAAFARILSPEHTVVTATSGQRALELVAAGPVFDVILCDLMMPQMTGMDLHAQLVAVAPDQAARVVFLTGGAFTPGARAFLEASSLARLEKPIEPGRLRAAINERVR